MQKNVASQKLLVFAFTASTNLPLSGDAGNITAYYNLDWAGVTVLTDTSATELDSTNAKGYYQFDLTQGETNGNTIVFSAKSNTSGVVVIAVPACVQTVPANYTLESIDSNGRLDIIKIAGTTQTARDIGASVLLSNGTGAGQLKLASGYVAMTWADIAAPTTTVGLSGTTVLAATTAVNLTNAPTAGDFTATMKTSLNAATPAVTVSDKTGFALTAAYDPAKTAAQAATALTNVTWTDARAGYIDNLNALKIKKNTALAAFPFLMVLSSDHVTPATGLSVTATRSLDGAAFGACANAVTELANGVYIINLAAADLNGNTVVLKFTAATADQRTIVIATEP
jgi:hypothetical protein